MRLVLVFWLAFIHLCDAIHLMRITNLAYWLSENPILVKFIFVDTLFSYYNIENTNLFIIGIPLLLSLPLRQRALSFSLILCSFL